ncbi:hypothetical protein NCS56_01548700 [Fusarium sp. Ph1]|nr:hypothetical protein NCS56_01548700 [Fusarium sp. Ph1]
MLSTESSAKLSLRTAADWTLWDDQFKSKAKRAQLWDYIDPETSASSRQTLAEATVAPTKPRISQFSKRTSTGNRSASASAASVAELHVDDIAIWTALTAEYNAERKDHELLMKKIDNLQEWMRETESYRRTTQRLFLRRGIDTPHTRRDDLFKEMQSDGINASATRALMLFHGYRMLREAPA